MDLPLEILDEDMLELCLNSYNNCLEIPSILLKEMTKDALNSSVTMFAKKVIEFIINNQQVGQNICKILLNNLVQYSFLIYKN